MPNSECSHSFSSWRNCVFSSRFVFAPPPVPALEILVICLLKTVTHRVASISLRILARVVPIEDSTCPGPHVSDQRFLLRLRNACSWLRSERPGRASPSKSEICDQNPSADGSSQEGSKLGRT